MGTPVKANFVIAGIIVAAASSFATARAATIPDAVYASEVDTLFTVCPFNPPGGNFCPGSVSIASDGIVKGPNGANASIFVLPNPTLTATANADDLSNVNAQISQASLTYYFTINGPVTGIYIPVDLTYTAITEANRTGSQAEAIVSMGGYNSQGGGTVLYNPGIGFYLENGSVTSNVFANTATPINLGVISIAVVNMGDSDSAYTKLDPVLSIDPSFASVDPNYLTDYSLSFSAGIGNLPDIIPAGVPEPATWLLSILGLGGVGAMLRRQRSRAQDERRQSGGVCA
jgi:PEP-CTERM motif-containing protein